MHRGSPPPSDSHPCNVIIFGETGAGKSSVVNLISGRELAKTSLDAKARTFKPEGYPVVLQSSSRPFRIWDTIGMNGPEISLKNYLRAVGQAYKLVKELECSGGVHLLLMCMRAGRITRSALRNRHLFVNVLCEEKVPLCVVVTGLENELLMEEWWTRNGEVIRKRGIFTVGHACITAIPGIGDVFRPRYEESRESLHKLLLDLDLQLPREGWKKDTQTWLVDLLGGLGDMPPLQNLRPGEPIGEELIQKLIKECGFTRKEARAIVASIRNLIAAPARPIPIPIILLS